MPPVKQRPERWIAGALDERTVEHLDDGLAWVLAHAPRQDVVIDLAGICRLEPCGVEALVRVGDLRADGRTLAVRDEPSGARSLLATAGLLDAPRRG